MTFKNAQCSTRCRFWILKISCKIGVLKQSQSALFCSASHMIVCSHKYDECRRSNEIIVCHRRWSILWSIVQVCSLTMEYRVFQYVPRISISEQFESILYVNGRVDRILQVGPPATQACTGLGRQRLALLYRFRVRSALDQPEQRIWCLRLTCYHDSGETDHVGATVYDPAYDFTDAVGDDFRGHRRELCAVMVTSEPS